MRRLALLLVVFLLGARAHRLIDPIEWVEVTPYTPATPEELLGERAALLVGDAAPLDGWLLEGQSYPRLVEELRDTSAALRQCEQGRREDRWYADTVHSATVEGLKLCRRSRVRDFAAGVGVGAGGCAAAGWAIEAAR